MWTTVAWLRTAQDQSGGSRSITCFRPFSAGRLCRHWLADRLASWLRLAVGLRAYSRHFYRPALSRGSKGCNLPVFRRRRFLNCIWNLWAPSAPCGESGRWRQRRSIYFQSLCKERLATQFELHVAAEQLWICKMERNLAIMCAFGTSVGVRFPFGPCFLHDRAQWVVDSGAISISSRCFWSIAMVFLPPHSHKLKAKLCRSQKEHTMDQGRGTRLALEMMSHLSSLQGTQDKPCRLCNTKRHEVRQCSRIYPIHPQVGKVALVELSLER